MKDPRKTIASGDTAPYQFSIMNEPLIPQKTPFVQETPAGAHFWCACGRSKTQPFCDGSHKGTGFGPLRVEVPQSRRIAWCGCKHTANKPFCDGSHSGLK